jgi:hypothetical protein
MYFTLFMMLSTTKSIVSVHLAHKFFFGLDKISINKIISKMDNHLGVYFRIIKCEATYLILIVPITNALQYHFKHIPSIVGCFN